MLFIYGLCRKLIRDQRGQALPLTLAALLLGGLVIAPFLTQTGGSLTGSRHYHTTMDETYAADAGIEHAVWRLIDDGLAGVLPDVGNTLTYSLPIPVNAIAPNITVTNTQAVGLPTGTISDAVINSYEYDTGDGIDPSIIPVSGTVYAVAYTGPGSDGWLKTVSIAADGAITQATISSYEFDTANSLTPHIIHVSGTVYAIAYTGPGNDGWVKTVNIAAGGAITQSTISSYEFDAADGLTPRIVYVSGTVYAIAYTSTGSDGWLKTVNIAADGVITQATISSYEFDTSNGLIPRIIHVSGTVYAIAYTGPGNDGWLKTVTIAANGAITQATTDSWEFNTSDGAECFIFPVSGEIYGIAYRGPGNSGQLLTVNIAPNGIITKSAISSILYENVRGYEPFVVFIGSDVYAIAYRNAASNGYLKTFTILSDGQITGVAIDSVEFESAGSYEPWIVNVGADTFAIAYRGPQADGWIKTIGITQTGGSGTAVFSVQSIANSISITASVSVTGSVAAIDSWVVNKQ